MSRRSVALVVSIAVASFLLGGGGRSTLALFNDTENDPSTFATAASFGATYHLHNNPTPPTGNTNGQANLTMDTTAATATILRNYDQNRNADAGLTLLKGGSGASETGLTRYQNWRTTIISPGRTINGAATLTFWSAMKGFALNQQGAVTAFLRDFDPTTSAYTTIASNTLTVANWQGGSATWVQKALTMTASNYNLPSGHRLEVKIIVNSTAANDMWFAYDTTAYPSRVTVP